MGEAGVGYGLLRMARPDTPSVLLPGAAGWKPIASAAVQADRGQRERFARAHFGRTIALMKRPPFDVRNRGIDADPGPSGETELAWIARALERAVAGEDPGRSSVVTQTWALERETFCLQADYDPWAWAARRSTGAALAESEDLPEKELALTPGVVLRCVRSGGTEEAGDGGADDAADGSSPPAEWYLLFGGYRGMQALPLSTFSGQVLRAFESAITPEQVWRRLWRESVGGAIAAEPVERAVLAQVREGLRSGILGPPANGGGAP